MTIEVERLERLRATMADHDVSAILTADPINTFYATGVRNMSIFSMMGAVRLAFIPVRGLVVLWEFAGAEHLTNGSTVVSETRTAPGITATSGPGYTSAILPFAHEISDLVAETSPDDRRLAVERFDHPVTDALRAAGLTLSSASEVFADARMVKTPHEVRAMRDAMSRVTRGVESMRELAEPGRSEVEVWSELHRSLIAENGEYISTRLAQAGHRTFPYFNEAGDNTISNGDVFCIDTDAIGAHGYAVDFSRTFVLGDTRPTAAQGNLHELAFEQLSHNASLLQAGRSFESFAASAWHVPEAFAEYGYYCLAHGLGLSGEHPYIPKHKPAQPYPLAGNFEPGMVICVESYIGDERSHQGIKLEDQYLITSTGSELMSTMRHGLTTD